jgi:hypothetical protein
LKSLFHWLRSLKPATDYIVVAPEGLVDIPVGGYVEALDSAIDRQKQVADLCEEKASSAYSPASAYELGRLDGLLSALILLKERAEPAPSNGPGPASPSGADEAEEG